ncbi:MAG TPA: hypothetical protein VF746_01110 [Longimicrobium sp.]|jgi:hypothetical protein
MKRALATRRLGGLAFVAVLPLVAWGAATCRPSAAAAPPCDPVEGPLAAGASAEALAGEFRLTLAATRGARAGSSVSGRLRLQPFGGDAAAAPAAPGARYPLYGSARLELDSVGAVAPGDLASAAPARPGVLVVEWRRGGAEGQREITLRFGADANGGGPQRFDGAHLALSVAALSERGFAGRWESGVEAQGVGGHFCAERIASTD